MLYRRPNNKGDDVPIATWELLLAVNPADPELKRVRIKRPVPLWYHQDWVQVSRPPTPETLCDLQIIRNLGIRLQEQQQHLLAAKQQIRDSLLEDLANQKKERLLKAHDRFLSLNTLYPFWPQQLEALRNPQRQRWTDLLRWFTQLQVQTPKIS